MKPEAALLHAALLVGPAAITGRLTAAGMVAVFLWVAATAVETTHGHVLPEEVPVAERLRALGLLATIWIATLWTGPLQAPLVLGGASAVVMGLALRMAAIRTLGRGFSAGLAPRGPVIHDGPYRWMRHPSELGLVLMAGGVVAVTASPLGAWSWVVLVMIPSLLRSRAEDRVLARHS